MATDWQRSLVTLTATVVAVTVVGVLYWARAVFIPIALAIFLSFVMAPLVMRVQRPGVGRVPAVVLTVGLVAVGLIAIGTVVTQQVALVLDTLPDYQEAIKGKIVTAKRWVVGDGDSRLGHLVNDVWATLVPPSNAERVVVAPADPLTTQVSAYVSPAAEFLGQGALVLVLTIFMLLKKEDLRNRLIRLLGDGKVTTTTRAVDDVSTRISRFLFMQLMINTGFGVVITVGLFILGVNYALLWGLIATVMRYVPYVGTILGLLPAVLFSFATAPGWGQPLAVLALFLVCELIANNVFEPWLFGKSMGLSEVAQLVAAAFWVFLWGPIGLILSGPMTVCLLVLGRHVRRFHFLEVLLGDRPALAPRVAFYQRLTARDRREAEQVVRSEAKESGPDEALDTVVVPALCIARRDLDDGDLSAADFRSVVRDAGAIVADVAAQRAEIVRPSAEHRVRVLIVPARDEAEHVAADAFAATLDPARWEARVVGDEMLASELVESVDEFDPAVVVLVVLPPGGLAHCRYLINRLRSRTDGLSVVVGRWVGEGKGGPDAEGIKGTDGVDLTPAGTRKRLADLLPVFAARQEKEARTHEGAVTPIGTAGA